MYLFAIATLIPLPLFAAGAALGGLWALAALAYITLFVFALDELAGRAIAAAPEAVPDGAEFPAADRLSILLAVAHFGLLALAIAAMTGVTGIGWGARIALFFGFGLYFGQVSNSNAHELIHRQRRGLFRLGMWVYISLLFGHHTSAHRHIHHRFVGTVDDPNTAVLGESFYGFAPRAWWGSFRAGMEIETALRKGRAHLRRGGWRREQGSAFDPHPYGIYLAGAAGCLVLATLAFGPAGLLAYLLLAAYAQIQLLVSDYVQHYGLERRRVRHGRTEPVSAAHSWNAAHWFSSALMLNAPRHSAHHLRPGTQYPALGLPAKGEAPRLPYSLPVMGAIALYPPLWHRMMDKRARRWRGLQAKQPLRAPEEEADPLVPPEEPPEEAEARPTLEAPVADAPVQPPKPAPEPAAAQDDAAIAEAVARTIALAEAPEGKG